MLPTSWTSRYKQGWERVMGIRPTVFSALLYSARYWFIVSSQILSNPIFASSFSCANLLAQASTCSWSPWPKISFPCNFFNVCIQRWRLFFGFRLSLDKPKEYSEEIQVASDSVVRSAIDGLRRLFRLIRIFGYFRLWIWLTCCAF